tara:strand:- start:1677 stop:1946 length:270 start_codon:yes stop_codon:yes gene_type:complete
LINPDQRHHWWQLGKNTDVCCDLNDQRGASATTTMALICCATCGHMHSSLRRDCPQCSQQEGKGSLLPLTTLMKTKQGNTKSRDLHFGC